MLKIFIATTTCANAMKLCAVRPAHADPTAPKRGMHTIFTTTLSTNAQAAKIFNCLSRPPAVRRVP